MCSMTTGNMNRAIFSLTLVLIISISQAETDSTEENDIEDAIRDNYDIVVNSVNSGSASGIASLYADDAKYFHFDTATLTGKTAIETLYTSVLQTTKKINITNIQVLEISDDEGLYVHTNNEAEVFDVNDNSLGTGRSMMLWKLIDGEYLIYRQMDNNLP